MHSSFALFFPNFASLFTCFMLHYFYVADFNVAVSSCCTLFVLVFLCCTFFPCCTFTVLHFYMVRFFFLLFMFSSSFTLFVLHSCLTILKLHFFVLTFFMLHSFHVALFPCCTFFLFCYFHVALFKCCSFFFVLHPFYVALSRLNLFRKKIFSVKNVGAIASFLCPV